MGDLQILCSYRALFAECFKANIEIENEIVSLEDSKVLEELEPDEVLENIKDLLKSLIEFKKFVRKAEENEYSEIEISNISTPAPEETQTYQIVKNINEVNDQLKKETQSLQARVKLLESKLKEAEEEIKAKNLEILEIGKKISIEKNDEGKINPEFVHARVNSEIIQSETTRNKCNMIKSVKFEYFPSNFKKIEARVKPLAKKKIMNSTVSSPEKLKPTHSRSSSNVFVNVKKFR